METSWLQSSATVTFLSQLFTRTQPRLHFTETGEWNFSFRHHTGLNRRQPQISLLRIEDKKIIYINIYFYLKRKKKKERKKTPPPQTPNTFHHFPPPVLIQTYLRLRGYYPHKLCHCVHGVKGFQCMGPSGLQALAAQSCTKMQFQVASVGSGCQSCTLLSL